MIYPLFKEDLFPLVRVALLFVFTQGDVSVLCFESQHLSPLVELPLQFAAGSDVVQRDRKSAVDIPVFRYDVEIRREIER